MYKLTEKVRKNISSFSQYVTSIDLADTAKRILQN